MRQTLIKKCDIFIDQLILGSYGMATMEALTYGKPVLCFMKDSVRNNEFPENLPIINSNPLTVYQNLKILLDNPTIRYETGGKSREYALAFHDINKVMPRLTGVYYKEVQKKISKHYK